MMNRKAIGWSTVAALIIGLAFLLVILIFLLKIRNTSVNIVEDSECKSSIMSHYVIKQITREVLVSEIYCPTRYYTIPGKNDDETKKQLADALKSCWGTWGRGQLDLFKDEALYCHVCSLIDFKDKSRTVSGITEYLLETPIEPGSPITYIDYLSGYASEKAEADNLQRLENIKFGGTIDTSKTYSVMFVYAKGKGNVKKFLDWADALGAGTIGGGITTGATLGVVTGAGLVIAGVASAGTAVIVAGVVTGIGAAVGALTADDVDWVSTVIFQEYNAAFLEKTLQCEISPARQDKVQKALG
jgi:hypothetical protein